MAQMAHDWQKCVMLLRDPKDSQYVWQGGDHDSGTHKNYNVKQGICPQSIRAMDTDACSLTGRIQPVYSAFFPTLCIYIQNLSMVIRRYATHTVMYRWQHRYRFSRYINASEDTCRFRDSRQSFHDNVFW